MKFFKLPKGPNTSFGEPVHLSFAMHLDPDLFVVRDDEPPEPMYLKRKCNKKWYCVPLLAGPVFQQLVLRTSLMLGTDTPPPVFWSTRIESVTEEVVPCKEVL